MSYFYEMAGLASRMRFKPCTAEPPYQPTLLLTANTDIFTSAYLGRYMVVCSVGQSPVPGGVSSQ